VDKALPALLEHARELKRELVDFAENNRFDRWLRPLLEQAAAVQDPREREAQLIRALDDFVMTFRFPDGDTLIDRFLAARPDLPDADRELLSNWKDQVESIFEVSEASGASGTSGAYGTSGAEAKDVGHLTLRNLIDDLDYELYYLDVGAEALRDTGPGDLILVRLVPLVPLVSLAEGAWMISGLVGSSPKSRKAIKLALRLAADAPELAFRNPDLLKRSWEAMRRDRERFIEFFGSDEVILDAADVDNRVNAFRLHAKKATRAEAAAAAVAAAQAGAQAEAGAGADGGVDFPADYFAQFELPPDLHWGETVGLIYDEVGGQEFVVNYDRAKAMFAKPALASEKEHARLLQSYLKEETVTPVPLTRLAEAHPDTADEVFAKILKRPDFTWAADGEALLRKHKAWYYAEERHPCVTVLGTRLRDLALS
jgi:hypothetical protein